jgi:chromosome condensin MukBEF ATPase and DNA-binding subunit MukB
MLRLALYAAGVSAGLAAWIVFGQRNGVRARVPVRDAAEMLREAWADNHTQA